MAKVETSELTDSTLVEGCIRGDSRYQEMLYKRFFSFAMSISVRYVPRQTDAMEVVNDSFMKAFNALSSMDTSRPFKPWFARIVVNTAIDSHRKQTKYQEVITTNDMPDSPESDIDIVSELSADDIVKILHGIPDSYRMVFNLYEIEGYSHDEIASMMNTTAATSRANLSRAKRLLKASYHKYCKEERRHYEAI